MEKLVVFVAAYAILIAACFLWFHGRHSEREIERLPLSICAIVLIIGALGYVFGTLSYQFLVWNPDHPPVTYRGYSVQRPPPQVWQDANRRATNLATARLLKQLDRDVR